MSKIRKWFKQIKVGIIFDEMDIVAKHLNNIFKSRELYEKVVSSILEYTTKHGAKNALCKLYFLKFQNSTLNFDMGAYYE